MKRHTLTSEYGRTVSSDMHSVPNSATSRVPSTYYDHRNGTSLRSGAPPGKAVRRTLSRKSHASPPVRRHPSPDASTVAALVARRTEKSPEVDRRYSRGNSRKRSQLPQKPEKSPKTHPKDVAAAVREHSNGGLSPPVHPLPFAPPQKQRTPSLSDMTMLSDQTIFRRSPSLLGMRRHRSVTADEEDESYLDKLRWGGYLNPDSPGNSLLCRRHSLAKDRHLEKLGQDYDESDKVLGYVRVRGASGTSAAAHDAVTEYSESAKMAMVAGRSSSASAQHFDGVFGTKATQGDIYRAVGAQALDQLFSGYNASIVALGSAESGNTETMLGKPCPELPRTDGGAAILTNQERPSIEDPGLIPNLCEAVFKTIAERDRVPSAEPGMRSLYRVEMAYSEIHGEFVRDVFAEDVKPAGTTRVRVNPIRGPQLNTVPARVVDSWKDCSVLLDRAFHQQAARAAASNRVQPHTYVRLTLFQLHHVDGKEMVAASTLHMLDIADASANRLPRMQTPSDLPTPMTTDKNGGEPQTVVDEIMSVVDEVAKRNNRYQEAADAGHGAVPYSLSLLTEILADSIGGSCKAAFIASVSSHPGCAATSSALLECVAKLRGIVNPSAKNEDCIANATLDIRNALVMMHADRIRLRASGDEDALAELQEDIQTANSASKDLVALSQDLHLKFVREFRTLQSQVRHLESEMALANLRQQAGDALDDSSSDPGEILQVDLENNEFLGNSFCASNDNTNADGAASAHILSPHSDVRKTSQSFASFASSSMQLDQKFDTLLTEIRRAARNVDASPPASLPGSPTGSRLGEKTQKKYEMALLTLGKEIRRLQKKGALLGKDNLQVNYALDSLSRRLTEAEAENRLLSSTNQKFRLALEDMQPGISAEIVKGDKPVGVKRMSSFRVVQAQADEAEALRDEVASLRKHISETDSAWQHTLDQVRTGLVKIDFDSPDAARDAIVSLLGLCNGSTAVPRPRPSAPHKSPSFTAILEDELESPSAQFKRKPP
eukprot:TRINITY_DN15382_c0_g1_i1.p1 TRINITY_DN15382_c0_g1~~TRINITY_DN15382_c0_g1_i1.p1  ORF type:complete len:1004 (+),score=195.24 TRINITY_DN15382_c0_g1_i1:79-3090(+)